MRVFLGATIISFVNISDIQYIMCICYWKQLNTWKMGPSQNSTFSHMMCYIWLDIPPIVSHSSRAATPICTVCVVTTATEVNLDRQFWSLAVEHTVWCMYVCVWCGVCVCVCVCVRVCVCAYQGEVNFLCTILLQVWKRSRSWLSMSQLDHYSYCVWMCVSRGEVTPICTTVIGDQIVTVINGQDMIISGWLMDKSSQNCRSKCRVKWPIIIMK